MGRGRAVRGWAGTKTLRPAWGTWSYPLPKPREVQGNRSVEDPQRWLHLYPSVRWTSTEANQTLLVVIVHHYRKLYNYFNPSLITSPLFINGKRKLGNVACQISHASARETFREVPCLLGLPVLQRLQVPFQLLALPQGSISALHGLGQLFLTFPKNRFHLGRKRERMYNILKHNKPVSVVRYKNV